jgi:hypothetical protein
VNLGLAPGAKINGVQGDAEHVRRNEAKLRCAKADEANHDAIDCGENPTLPTSPSYKNGGNDGKYAG